MYIQIYIYIYICIYIYIFQTHPVGVLLMPSTTTPIASKRGLPMPLAATPISSASGCCRKNVRTRGGKTITSSHKEIRTTIR